MQIAFMQSVVNSTSGLPRMKGEGTSALLSSGSSNSSNLIDSNVNFPQSHFILFPELCLLISICFNFRPASWVQDKIETGKSATQGMTLLSEEEQRHED